MNRTFPIAHVVPNNRPSLRKAIFSHINITQRTINTLVYYVGVGREGGLNGENRKTGLNHPQTSCVFKMFFVEQLKCDECQEHKTH